MEILIKKIKENKDGSAEVHVYYDKEGLHFLVQQGMTCTLVEAIMMERNGKMFHVTSVLDTIPKKNVVKKQQTKKK
jgi:acid stress-induced BolA-like protein IbaG/YrbA